MFYLEVFAALVGLLVALVATGFLLNLLLFPDMWQQLDLPRWVRWLAGG